MNSTTDNSEKGSGSDSPAKKSISIGRYIILTTILLIITFMVFSLVKYLFLGETKPLTLPIIQQAYSYEEMVPVEVAETEASAGPYEDNDTYQGQKAFEAEQYALAIKHYNKVLLKNSNRFDLKLYTALAHLKLGNDDLAQQYFYQIINHADKSLYAPRALWYSALVDLKNNNLTDCRNALDEMIAMPICTKAEMEQAVQLKEKLDGF